MIFNFEKIKKNKLTYVIAEIGVNHECSLKKAKKMILLAKKNGASAAKFQTYKSDTIVSKNSPAYWDLKKEKTKSQYLLFKKYDKFDEKDYIELAKYCKKINIDFLSTPFDLVSVDFLKKLVPAFKISSSDITNVQLLRKVAKTQKPIILSTGASNIKEIKFAIKQLHLFGSKKIILLHCILNYPTKDADANLSMILHLKKVFPNFIIGYSDHTLPDKQMVNLSAAYLMGARVIEKHFTLNKKKKGNDHYHSMNEKDLKILSQNLKKIKTLIGSLDKKVILKSEKKSRLFARRSLFYNKNLKKGVILKNNDIISLRPGDGITADKIDLVVGKKLKKNQFSGNQIKFGDLVRNKNN